MLGARAIDNRVAKIADIEARKRELNAELEALKNELKDEMSERGIDELHGSKFRVSWKDVVSHRFDSALFKKERGALYSEYLKVVSDKRFLWAAA